MNRYRVLASATPPNQDNLDEMATDGWHLVTILADREHGYLSYFRREKRAAIRAAEHQLRAVSSLSRYDE